MWVETLTLLWLLAVGSPICIASFNIKHSLEECSFHYAANDPTCNDYRFTHCAYYSNTTSYWLWIFRDEIKSELITQPALQVCASVCCKDEANLPSGLDGYMLCQERKFAKEIVQVQFLEIVIQLAFGLFLLSIVSSVLYAAYQAIERYLLELQAQPPREIQMRLL